MKMTKSNNYNVTPLTEGVPTDYKRPLLLVAMEGGQANQVGELLNRAGLVIEEKETYPFFKLIDRRVFKKEQ